MFIYYNFITIVKVHIHKRHFFIGKCKKHVCSTDYQPAQFVADVVAKSPDMPLSHEEDKLATSLVQRKLQEAEDQVSADYTLAIKAYLNIPWSKLRAIRR